MTKKILPLLIKLAALELIVLLFLAFFTFGDDPTDVYAQVGAQCRFDQASCSWDAVADATSYSVTITEEDSNSVVKQETVNGATKLIFDVTANKTYRCDVSAINSCGNAGPAGSASALCAAEGVASAPPSQAPTAKPVVTQPPAPTPAPPAPTQRPIVSCGSSCNDTSDCQQGLTCLKIANGESYCAKPEYQTACVSNPTIASCCQAPIVKTVELPKSGLVEDTLWIMLSGIAIAVLGIGGILFTSRKRG